MVQDIDIQEKDFATWQLGRKLPKTIIDILHLIKTREKTLDSALSPLASVVDGLSRRNRHSDDVVDYLQKKHSMDLFEEVKGAKGVFIALNAAGVKLDAANSKSGFGKFFKIPQKEAAVSFKKLYNQLGDHLVLIQVMLRDLCHASQTEETDVFWREYNGLDRMDPKGILEELRLRFDQKPFAVTVSLGPERQQPGEEGRDHADTLYGYLGDTKGEACFLQLFQDMGSEWAAVKLGDSPRCEMQKLEMAHTQLSCGLINALRQSAPPNEEICPLQEDIEFLRGRLANWEELTRHQKIIIAIGGHFSHGKSSFLNALMGEDVLPTNSESNQHGETKAYIKQPRDIHNCNTLPHST